MAGVTKSELMTLIDDAIREPLRSTASEEFGRFKPSDLSAAIAEAVADAIVLAAERGVETGEG